MSAIAEALVRWRSAHECSDGDAHVASMERAVEACLRDSSIHPTGTLNLTEAGDALVWLVESSRRKQWSRHGHMSRYMLITVCELWGSHSSPV